MIDKKKNKNNLSDWHIHSSKYTSVMRLRQEKCKVANKRQIHPYESVKNNIKKHSKWLVVSKSSEIAKIDTMLQCHQKSISGGLLCIRERRHVESEIKALHGKLEHLVRDINLEEFIEQVRPILNHKQDTNTKTNQQRNALFVNLFHYENSAPSFLDQETCHNCKGSLLISGSDSMAICSACGESNPFLHCSADYMEHESSKVVEYERTPLYRRYLTQFHKDAENPSYDILSVVYNELSTIHMMLSCKVKPTPVTQIMRKYSHHKWAHMAQRLCKFINSEKIPMLSSELIDKLVCRFNKISDAFLETSKQQNRKKIMNFEYLTRNFLKMEGMQSDADCFGLHKSRSVVDNADQILGKCCRHIINNNQACPGESWTI